MTEIINNILDQEPAPDLKNFERNRRLLWLSAAISLMMAIIGYIIIVILIF